MYVMFVYIHPLRSVTAVSGLPHGNVRVSLDCGKTNDYRVSFLVQYIENLASACCFHNRLLYITYSDCIMNINIGNNKVLIYVL